MKCGDYSAEDSWCARGMPLAPLFAEYFCEKYCERCPLFKWSKTLPDPSGVVRPGKLSDIRRKT